MRTPRPTDRTRCRPLRMAASDPTASSAAGTPEPTAKAVAQRTVLALAVALPAVHHHHRSANAERRCHIALPLDHATAPFPAGHRGRPAQDIPVGAGAPVRQPLHQLLTATDGGEFHPRGQGQRAVLLGGAGQDVPAGCRLHLAHLRLAGA
eukprot:ctg_868.g433